MTILIDDHDNRVSRSIFLFGNFPLLFSLLSLSLSLRINGLAKAGLTNGSFLPISLSLFVFSYILSISLLAVGINTQAFPAKFSFSTLISSLRHLLLQFSSFSPIHQVSPSNDFVDCFSIDKSSDYI